MAQRPRSRLKRMRTRHEGHLDQRSTGRRACPLDVITSPAGEPAQAARIGGASPAQLSRSAAMLIGCALSRAEAQQRGDIADLVELRIVFHVEHFDVAANHPRQDGFAHVDNFLRGPATNRAEADEMGIQVAASGTFDGVRLKVLSEQQQFALRPIPASAVRGAIR